MPWVVIQNCLMIPWSTNLSGGSGMIHTSPRIMRLPRSPLDLAPGCALVSTYILRTKPQQISKVISLCQISDGMELAIYSG